MFNRKCRNMGIVNEVASGLGRIHGASEVAGVGRSFSKQNQ